MTEQTESTELVEELTQDSAEEVSGGEVADIKSKGWKDYDTYVADGGDPDMYRGPKAFAQYKEMKDEGKSKVDETNQRMIELIEMQEKQQKAAEERGRAAAKAEIESKMSQAKENLDFNAYEEARAELDDHTKEHAPAPKTSEPNKAWLDTVKEIPMLDQSGTTFNKTLFTVFQANLNDELVKIGKPVDQLSQYEIDAAMRVAKESSKTDLPHLFKEQRKAPATATPNSKGGAKGNLSARLDAGQRKIYDHFMKSGKKDAAEKFANGILGE